jgi:hypothetical protein
MHAGKQLKTVGLPAIGTALQYVHALIPQRLKTLCRTGGDIPTVLVIDHQPHQRIRRQTPDLQFQSAIGQVHPKEQVGLTILAVFAHIKQGNFLPVEQPLLQLPRGYGLAHGSPALKINKTKMIGEQATNVASTSTPVARGLAPVGSRSGPQRPFRQIELSGFTTAAQPHGGEPPRHRLCSPQGVHHVQDLR